jgi:hypothetical protein
LSERPDSLGLDMIPPFRDLERVNGMRLYILGRFRTFFHLKKPGGPERADSGTATDYTN